MLNYGTVVKIHQAFWGTRGSLSYKAEKSGPIRRGGEWEVRQTAVLLGCWALCFIPMPMQHHAKWQDLRRRTRTHARKPGTISRALRLNASHWLSFGVNIPETVFDSSRSAWQVVRTYSSKRNASYSNKLQNVCVFMCVHPYVRNCTSYIPKHQRLVFLSHWVQVTVCN